MTNTCCLAKRIFSVHLHRVVFAGLLVVALSACQAMPAGNQPTLPEPLKKTTETATPEIMVMDTNQPLSLESIIPMLAEKKVVLVGESHDNYQHHLNQLAVIKALHAINPDMAIGLEFFQFPFQQVMDDYIAGKIDEQAFLEKTEYYERWKYDYRLYQPIINFARENRIPLVALNMPTRITKKVAKEGIESLSAEDKLLLPDSIDREVPGYRERIESIFAEHPGMKKRNIDYFIDAQLLWDEGMAEQAANYLNEHPSKKMVILAGAGHVMFGTGIPIRLQRRINAEIATVMNDGIVAASSKAADYILFTKDTILPKSGLIGVFLEPAEQGMKIGSFSPDSDAEKAGMLKDDRIVLVEGRGVNKISDLRLELWNKMPGDKVNIVVMRDASGQAAVKHEFEVVLK